MDNPFDEIKKLWKDYEGKTDKTQNVKDELKRVVFEWNAKYCNYRYSHDNDIATALPPLVGTGRGVELVKHVIIQDDFKILHIVAILIRKENTNEFHTNDTYSAAGGVDHWEKKYRITATTGGNTLLNETFPNIVTSMKGIRVQEYNKKLKEGDIVNVSYWNQVPEKDNPIYPNYDVMGVISKINNGNVTLGVFMSGGLVHRSQKAVSITDFGDVDTITIPIWASEKILRLQDKTLVDVFKDQKELYAKLQNALVQMKNMKIGQFDENGKFVKTTEVESNPGEATLFYDETIGAYFTYQTFVGQFSLSPSRTRFAALKDEKPFTTLMNQLQNKGVYSYDSSWGPKRVRELQTKLGGIVRPLATEFDKRYTYLLGIMGTEPEPSKVVPALEDLTAENIRLAAVITKQLFEIDQLKKNVLKVSNLQKQLSDRDKTIGSLEKELKESTAAVKNGVLETMAQKDIVKKLQKKIEKITQKDIVEDLEKQIEKLTKELEAQKMPVPPTVKPKISKERQAILNEIEVMRAQVTALGNRFKKMRSGREKEALNGIEIALQKELIALLTRWAILDGDL